MGHKHIDTDIILDTDDHGHILFVYSTMARRMQVLAEYFGDGIKDNELCIFVTPESVKDTMLGFKKAGTDFTSAVKRNQLRIFDMNESYLPQGDFVGDDMLLNVVNFIIEAKNEGYNGVRTAGEMAWLYSHPEYLTEATRYEQQVNELNLTNPEFTGMCLYPIAEGIGDIIDSSLSTHPSFVQDGITQPNPVFRPAAA